jgi:hypothetical protein
MLLEPNKTDAETCLLDAERSVSEDYRQFWTPFPTIKAIFLLDAELKKLAQISEAWQVNKVMPSAFPFCALLIDGYLYVPKYRLSKRASR